MAEIIEAPAAEVAAPVQQPVPVAQAPADVPLSEKGQQVAQLLDFAAKNPDFAKKPEIVALKAEVDKIKGTKNGATNPEAAPAAQAAAQPAAEAPAVETPAEEKPEEKKSIFRANKATTLAEFKSVEDHAKYIKEKFGVEDPAKFYQTAEKWRTDSQSLPEVSDRAAGLEKVLTDAPDVIYEALQVWGKGGDWMQALKENLPSLDYNKGFDKQVNTVVNHYFKGKFSQEELQDTTDPVVSNAIEVAKTKFDLEKGQLETKRADTLARADKTAKAIKESVSSSVEKFEESFPEFDTRRKSELKQIMLSGDLNSLFYKKDGTFKPEAAKMLALALYGEEEITGEVNKATKKTESKATTKVLMEQIERSKATPPATTSDASAQPKSEAELKSVLDRLNKKNYY